MPVYEYICADCKRSFEVRLTFDEYDRFQGSCPSCKSANIWRKIRMPRVISDESRRIVSEIPAESGDNPAALGRMMRQMQAESGEKMPAEYDEVVSRLEDGQSLEAIDNHFAADENGTGE